MENVFLSNLTEFSHAAQVKRKCLQISLIHLVESTRVCAGGYDSIGGVEEVVPNLPFLGGSGRDLTRFLQISGHYLQKVNIRYEKK